MIAARNVILRRTAWVFWEHRAAKPLLPCSSVPTITREDYIIFRCATSVLHIRGGRILWRVEVMHSISGLSQTHHRPEMSQSTNPFVNELNRQQQQQNQQQTSQVPQSSTASAHNDPSQYASDINPTTTAPFPSNPSNPFLTASHSGASQSTNPFASSTQTQNPAMVDLSENHHDSITDDLRGLNFDSQDASSTLPTQQQSSDLSTDQKPSYTEQNSSSQHVKDGTGVADLARQAYVSPPQTDSENVQSSQADIDHPVQSHTEHVLSNASHPNESPADQAYTNQVRADHVYPEQVHTNGYQAAAVATAAPANTFAHASFDAPQQTQEEGATRGTEPVMNGTVSSPQHLDANLTDTSRRDPASGTAVQNSALGYTQEYSPLPTQESLSSAAPGTAQSPVQYAPPPGPPPMDTNGHRSYDQMAADEAYARKLWEAEQQRRRRHDQRRHTNGRTSSRNIPRSEYVAAQPRSSSNRDTNEEAQWNTKDIYWRGRGQRIIVQNENGPCSLIALCNVLLLTNTIQLTPADRPVVSYSYLSSLLGEFLVDIITTNPEPSLDVDAALSILPQTQHGLDVNVRFSSIDGFAEDIPGSHKESVGSAGSKAKAKSSENDSAIAANKQSGELALFKLCGVPLVHGWLADASDNDTWAAVVERSGDYDRALDRIVAGNELAKDSAVGNELAGQASSASTPVNVHDLSEADQLAVNDAILIRRFLDSSSTQLTYTGLYALSTQLDKGKLYALFRNSHLSVIYRPLDEENHTGGTPHDQAQLFQLVTDGTLENEDEIVWESIEDVDGSASRFFNGKFQPTRLTGDFARQTQQQPSDFTSEEADRQYAEQLQYREQQRARQYHDRRHDQVYSRRNSRQPPSDNNPKQGVFARLRGHGRNPSQTGQLRSDIANQMGGGRNREQHVYPQPPATNTQTPGLVGEGEEIPQPTKQGKWWKRFT